MKHMQGVQVKLPDPLVDRILLLLLRDYNSRTSATAPIWAVYEIVYARQQSAELKIVFRMVDTVCKKKVLNQVRCPPPREPRRVQCKIYVAERVSAKNMLCKALDPVKAKRHITYTYTRYETIRWWWRYTETKNVASRESSTIDASQIHGGVQINLTAVAYIAVLKLNREQAISDRIVNHFGRSKIYSARNVYEAVVYVAETECSKSKYASMALQQPPCAFIYPGKSYECFVSISKSELKVQGPVRCGPTDKESDVLDIPDAHSKNLLQIFMREYNSRTCPEAMLWALYGISVIRKVNNEYKAVIEIAETTCTKQMPPNAKCRFFNGAHKRQCRVAIEPSVKRTRMLCEQMKEIEKMSTSSTVYQKYQIKRWLWDPIFSLEKVIVDNNEHILMGDDNMQFISRDAIGKQAAEVLNWKQNISRLLLMHFGEVELSYKGGSYEAVVHLAESNCLKQRQIGKSVLWYCIAMDLQELFRSCRTGDMEKLRYLVEEREVMVNVRDKWDSTPLYYACLCGHYDVVEYLLNLGTLRFQSQHFTRAPNVFDRGKMPSEHIRRLFESGEHSDFTFRLLGNKNLHLHRCVLTARSAFFREKFYGAWRYKDSIAMRNKHVNPIAFEALMRYLYTGSLELPIHLKDDLVMIAKQCKIASLLEKMEICCRKTRLFESTKPGTCVTNIVIEPTADCSELKESFCQLAFQAMRQTKENDEAVELTSFYDVIFELDSSRFRCHQAFFCLKSEYFRTLLHSPLVRRESNIGACDSIKLGQFSDSVFKYVITHVYCEDVKLDVETVDDVLMVANFCLLPGLKRQCGLLMAQHLDTQNVCAALRAARLFQLHRLENQCYKFMADHLEEVIDECSFREMVVEDAQSLRYREDCDSIEVIDSIRYNLTFATLDEASEKFSMIDALLDELNLNA
ncbi:Ank 2 and BTB domain containing protein [Trichuris trichiura]|uniref:Ank 2 and BTB domain containing protein n=1 Tax=Trichuris trichiura TaxID=36087 RepID=A0A077Z1L1_TRITR|nr:Ank 2 and BTB domain containing protein [Trichuris trichiura]